MEKNEPPKHTSTVPLTEKRLVPVVRSSVVEYTTFPSCSSNSVQVTGGTVGVGVIGVIGVGGSVEAAAFMMIRKATLATHSESVGSYT